MYVIYRKGDEKLEQKIENLELKIENLEKIINLVDQYSRQMMNQTMDMLAIVITIATVVITGAIYFFIKNMINDKIDKEVERKVIKVLVENPPTFFARGNDRPNEKNEIILTSDLNGIKDLEPDSLMQIEVMPESQTWHSMGNGLIPILRIDENGKRVINIPGYSENNGKISWYITWLRKSYTN